ncbi:hypothetical protein FHP26_00750 [Pseudomonas orientalis]|nr:hypothetical protein [Pseudomonas orientalis]
MQHLESFYFCVVWHSIAISAVLNPVGASLLAKNPRAPRSFSMCALSLTSFASKLAPTVGEAHS